MKPPAWRALEKELSACRFCEDEGILPEARPIFQLPENARIGIFSQAPGNLAHQGGKPFLDPSGVRLRQWMGVSEAAFYTSGRIAIAPMAFCFPGYDGTSPTGRGGDLPPPKVCAARWRSRVMDLILPQLSVVLLVGRYALEWHLGAAARGPLSAVVGAYEERFEEARRTGRLMLPMPHPSWRNTAWLKKNPFFEAEVVPRLRQAVADALVTPTR